MRSLIINTLRLIACAFVLVACDGVYRTHELCPNLVFEGNTKHLTNQLDYGNSQAGDMLLSSDIDLVLSNGHYAILRQLNTRGAYCIPHYKEVYDSLKRSKITFIYWLANLDSVPRQLFKNESDERVESFLSGPYDEETAIAECERLGTAVWKMKIVYSYEVHHLPRWMKMVDTTYYPGSRKQRWWE